MDVIDVIMEVEGEVEGMHDEDELLAGIAEHRETLRHLQGFWGRLIADLESQGRI